MPLCLGASGSSGPGTPSAPSAPPSSHLLPGQPPAAVGAGRLSSAGAARSDPAPGSENSFDADQLADSVGGTLKRWSICSGVPVFEDRRHRPPADHQIGTVDTGSGHLPVDQQLFGRRCVAGRMALAMRRKQTTSASAG